MTLDVSSLNLAIEALSRSLRVYFNKDQDTTSDDELDTIRAGVIQSFEFTYELCWKFMKRWLEMNIGTESVDGVSRRELFRLAAESRLINDVEKWMEFHYARNKTSHTYGGEAAQNVFEASNDFLPYAQDFFSKLNEKL
ncbi:MAG: nucleotidyltransferase substrate binding protein [Desulfobulbaceae bacterium]|nr:nucleotidyltransferase substrate binding protein [Desulfobulbaceae bacterium]